MKKFALPGIILFSLLGLTSHAQLDASKEAALRSSESANAVPVNKANYKALKNFKKAHTDGADVVWHTGQKTITASMERNGKKTEVVFDRKGRWLRDMITYPESLLDKPIRNLVRQAYFDHKITMVQEFREGDATFYVIHLEDATTFLKLVYVDGQMGIYQKFHKQL